MYADLKNYKDIALLGASLILFNVFSIQWLFTGLNDFKYITIRSLLIRALSVIAIFLLVKGRDDFSIYFIILALTAFFTALIDIYYARKFISRKIILSFKGTLQHVKPIFVLGIYMILTSIYSVLPTTILGFLSTKLAVGYYYGANKIIRMVISVFTALITVMIPHLNLILEKKGKDEYFFLLNKSLHIVIIFGIPITFFVFLLANPIVMLLAGENFASSILLVRIMAPIILIVAMAQVFVLLILSVYRKDKNMVMLSAIGMFISLLINIIFIPRFAEKATAVSQLVGEFLVTLVSFFMAKKVFNFNFPAKKFLLNLACVIPFAMITFLSFKFSDNNFLIVTASGVLCGLYFLFYQLFILKDQFFKQITNPYFLKFKSYIATYSIK